MNMEIISQVSITVLDKQAIYQLLKSQSVQIFINVQT